MTRRNSIVAQLMTAVARLVMKAGGGWVPIRRRRAATILVALSFLAAGTLLPADLRQVATELAPVLPKPGRVSDLHKSQFAYTFSKQEAHGAYRNGSVTVFRCESSQAAAQLLRERLGFISVRSQKGSFTTPAPGDLAYFNAIAEESAAVHFVRANLLVEVVMTGTARRESDGKFIGHNLPGLRLAVADLARAIDTAILRLPPDAPLLP
jgi:hypothetical protein